MQLLIDELDLGGQTDAEAFLREREELLDELLPRAAVLPGAKRLLQHLSAAGVPIALATSSHRRHYEIKTAAHADMFALFDVIVTGDMVEQVRGAGIIRRDILAWSQSRMCPVHIKPHPLTPSLHHTKCQRAFTPFFQSPL